MNAKKIMFPTDFSVHAQAALDTAASIARQRGATLWIVHVEEPPAIYGEAESPSSVERYWRRDLERALQEVTPTRPDVPCEYTLLTGAPASALVNAAEEAGAEMIVMATHGRRGLSRLLMGSVAEQVVRTAKCPVLVVKSVPVREPAATS